MSKYKTVDPKDVFIDPYADLIEIWERWQTVDGVTYYEYKTPTEKEWHRKKTAYKEPPIQYRRYLHKEEYKRKLESLKESTPHEN